MGDRVRESERDPIVQADGACGDVYFLQTTTDNRKRVFVLVPLIRKRGLVLGEAGEDLGEVVALQRRAHDEGRGGFWEHVAEEAFGLAPVGAGLDEADRFAVGELKA